MPTNNDPNASLNDHATFQGQSKPNVDDLETRSLGDQATFAEAGDANDYLDDDMEIVDLSARYKIDKSLGKGGMGEVFLATDTRLNRKVAIKRILGDAARNRTAVSRFLTEAKSVAALNHHNVVQIYDFGNASDGPFLIMEYVDGGNLLERCRDAAIPLQDVIEIACQLCDGLICAHERGIIHRDIKPANVLLTSYGIPKLTDFGLAKAVMMESEHTMVGAILGTLDYMSPEQRRDAALADSRSDLWSLAATLYQIITGDSPRVIRISKVPESLRDILDKALEESRENRYHSTREFREALILCKKSLFPADPNGSAELRSGYCPACQTLNEPSRKFCRECGEPFRCACLKCQHEITIWDKVCAECGGIQTDLVIGADEDMEYKRLFAEELAAEGRLDDAMRIIQDILSVNDPRLARQRRKAEDYAKELDLQKSRLEKIVDASLQKARDHHDLRDYESAIKALESVPTNFRDNNINEYLDQLRYLRHKSTQFLDSIADRVKNGRLGGLLPLVLEAIAHCGETDYLLGIRDDLERRQADRKKELIEIKSSFRNAKSLFDNGETNKALDALKSINPSKLATEHLDFLGKLERYVDKEEEFSRLTRDAVISDRKKGANNLFDLYHRLSSYLEEYPEHVKVEDNLDDVLEHLDDLPAEILAQFCSQELETLPDSVHEKVFITNSIGIRMRLIPERRQSVDAASSGSSKELGSIAPFFLGIYPVTQGEFRKVMNRNPSYFQSPPSLIDLVIPGRLFRKKRRDCSTVVNEYDNRPVENLTIEEAVEFCERLSNIPEEKILGRIYRLATIGEWEYACRANCTTKHCFGNHTLELGQFAWYDSNSDGETHPVGLKKPNLWGLYDMLGNVSEWCVDLAGATCSPRGGGWNSWADDFLPKSPFESVKCIDSAPRRASNIGFRVALSYSGNRE